VSDEISFQADIRPIFLASCSACHAAGNLPNFASPDAAASYRVAARESEEILEVLEEGEMPLGTCSGGAPGTSGCVSMADFQLVSDWVEAGSPE